MRLLGNGTTPTIVLGPFLDDTDGKTAETLLSIAQADVRLSKNAGAFEPKNSATSASHLENGYYAVPLSATDTGTNGILSVAVSKAGALPVWGDFLVVPANVYNAICGETGQIRANVVQVSDDANAADNLEAACDGTSYNIGGGAVVAASVTGSVGSVAAGGITANSIATNAIDADALAADAVNEIWAKAMTELSAVPGVTGTVLEALQWLFLLSRNKITQTNSVQTLRNNADGADIATASVSDDGTTFTRAKFT